MKTIDQLRIRRHRGIGDAATIQLLAGDLAAIPPGHAVDALVVSAFPNSYSPDPGTLFKALYERGVDMRDVARRKQEDARSHLGCWLSTPLAPEIANARHFKRIICFEPLFPEFVINSGFGGSIEESVGFVFRCLNNFIIPDSRDARRFEITSVAMPLLATGNQQVPVGALLRRLLDAAIFWLEEGLPLRELKIVAFKPADVEVATRIFAAVKLGHVDRIADHKERTAGVSIEAEPEAQVADQIGRQVMQMCSTHLRARLMLLAHDDEKTLLQRLFDRMDAVAPPVNVTEAGTEYDVFISYAHKQSREVAELVRALEHLAPPTRVFFDRSSIPAGGQWIKMISDAVRRARIFVAVLSPEYSASAVCWDEFQCAKLKEYNTRDSVIRTVRLYHEEEIPLMFGIYSYIDCEPGDLEKLRGSAATLLGA